MNIRHKISLSVFAAVALAAVAGCAGSSTAGMDVDKITAEIAKRSFRDEGIVKAEPVLAGDETMRACSAADVAGKPLDAKTASAIEATNLKAVKWPQDGKYLGDWREGEKVAQSGRGQTFTDKAGAVNGGNCYNCRQITKKEISFGTIGPSLYQYGKLRGVSDPASEAAQPIVKYTWGKIWNSKAYSACSNMPRAGHKGILTEQQVAHIVALLLDPNSPVNE